MRILLIGIMVLLVCSGCSLSIKGSPVEEKSNGNFKTEYLGKDAGGWILTDSETGCQYIAQNNNVPYTPRLNSKGFPMCNETK